MALWSSGLPDYQTGDKVDPVVAGAWGGGEGEHRENQQLSAVSSVPSPD